MEDRVDWVEEYKNGTQVYGSQRTFVLEHSNTNLFKSLLPRKFRNQEPLTKDEFNLLKINQKRIKELDSLINFAASKGYVESPKESPDKAHYEIVTRTPKVIEDPIRISAEGDQFVTYWGGLEAFITTFPKTWVIVSLSLIPWILTNHTQIANFFKHLF